MLIPGSNIQRMRRNINPALLNDSRGNNSSILTNSSVVNSTANLLFIFLNVTPTPTQVVPNLWSNEDINITMHCESYWFSCRGRCTQERELGGTEERLQCFCDSSCEFFKDCCADFDQFCPSSGMSAHNAKSPDDIGRWKCVSSYNSFSTVHGVWMISSCPKNWTQDDIKDLCNPDLFLSYDNLKDNVPVIDGKGNTYKNHYCAQCHGLNSNDLTFYNFKFSCDVPVPNQYKKKEIFKFLSTFCDNPFWRPPIGARRRYCHLISPSYCYDISFPQKVQQKCFNGPLRLVYEKNGFYRRTFSNPYCALCSKVKNFSCGPGPYPSRHDPTLVKPFSLVMDLDFSDRDQLGMDREVQRSKVRRFNVSCLQGDEVYDFHLEVCRPGISPSDVISIHEKIFTISVWMRSETSSWGRPLITIVNFQEAIANKLNLNKTFISNISIGNPFGPVSTVVFNIHINPTIQKNISSQTFQTAMTSQFVILNNANFTVFKVAVKPFYCAVVETFYPSEYTFERNAVKIKNTGEIFQETDYYSNETEWINGSLAPIGILTVCKQPQLNCSGILVGLTEDEYVILPNGSLYRNISEELFQPGSFLLLNNTIWVCTQFSSNYEESLTKADRSSTTENDIVLVVLTYVGLSLSILSFVLVLVTYSLFKELRTLPGSYLMNLCLAHLLADLFYLATGYVNAKIACTIIAILLQYFFLVSFMWMSFIAFETWKAFSKIRIRNRQPNQREKRFDLLRRIPIGWLPAFVFVVVCVALDQTNVVEFHYGGIKGCWINNSTANLFFLLVPLAFSIFFNAVCFALTVRAIRKTNNQTRRATHEQVKRKTAGVFLKIFILMGFTWIFGFLKILVSQYFEYPFIIFTTLQGLYIALAFVFTSRVKQMYRALCCIMKTNLVSGSEDTRL
ncbi:uncharacterized protein LOC144649330 [Oculina patagonica]